MKIFKEILFKFLCRIFDFLYKICECIVKFLNGILDFFDLYLIDMAHIFFMFALIWGVILMIYTSVHMFREIEHPYAYEECTYRTEQQIIQEGE